MSLCEVRGVATGFAIQSEFATALWIVCATLQLAVCIPSRSTLLPHAHEASWRGKHA